MEEGYPPREWAFYEDMKMFDGAAEIAQRMHPDILGENLAKLETEYDLEHEARLNLLYQEQRPLRIAQQLRGIAIARGSAAANSEISQIDPELLPAVLAELKRMNEAAKPR